MKWDRNIGIGLSPICLALLVCGCTSVSITQPLSKEPKAIDREKFEGVWLMDNEPFHVRFGTDGIARIAGMEWKDNQFHVARAEMVVTKGVKHNFLSIRTQEDGKWTDGYGFVQYKFTDQGDLVIWIPNGGVFKEAVENKQLDGEIKKVQHSTEITITSDREKLLEFINDPDNLKLFEYRDPLILRKLTGNRETEQRDPS